ncbi:TonB-dependent receptor plug domain-containing protein [Morganella morganii]|uniref:TonB-dependent receptor n=1 Tax=bacterium 19GA11TI05 TaxID=2920688 RepID=A0AAU6TTE7_UNCXX|nr:TonB-dependent receptor [Morganella morganii]MDW7794672.1 TonB-dependent receptor [Morganella morganii]HDS3819041.1 TonB-dependent receptor [Morganella morganii subsp. morganii]
MKRTLLCSAILLATAPAVQAESADILTVWGSPVASNPDVITQPQMQSLNKTNAATAISTMPGVVLEKSGNRNELTVKVRGFDSRQVPVFFDGIPTYVPYDGNLDLGRFMTSELESIEVSKGYTSLLQGPNLMGGAINLTTATPKKPFEANVSFSQGFARGADNAYNTSARVGARNDLGFIQVSGSQYKQRFLGLPGSDDDNALAGSNGRRAHSSSDDKRGMVKVGWTPRETDQYVFTYLKQDGSKDSSPSAVPGKGKYSWWEWPDYNKESYYFNSTTQLTDGVNLQGRLFHDKFENTLLMYKKDGKGYDYSYYDDFSNGASLQLGIDMRESDLLSFSAHWKDDIHRAQKQRNGDILRYKDRTYSVATEYQWAATSDLDFIGAIGYDWRESRQADKGADDNDQHAFNWEVMSKYTFANQDNVRFSVSDRSRFPTQKERYTTEKPKDGSLGIINPNLKAERALTFDLTYEGNITDKWGYQASIYHNRVDDAILAHTVIKNGDRYFQNQNSGRVDYTGLDLGVKGEVSDWLKTGINYSYIHSDPKDVDHAEGLPKHKMYAWVKVTPIEPLSITLSEEFRAWSYQYNDSNEKVAGYALTDLRVDYDFGYGISANASVNNLFDKSYEYTNGYMEEGRNFWLGVEYRY